MRNGAVLKLNPTDVSASRYSLMTDILVSHVLGGMQRETAVHKGFCLFLPSFFQFPISLNLLILLL